MAKFECDLKGDFYTIIHDISERIVNGSVSASLEEMSDFCEAGAKCAVRIFERYSFWGQNRVSLSVTLFEAGGKIKLSATTSGGSQAIFFKINTVGEASFLECLYDAIKEYRIN